MTGGRTANVQYAALFFTICGTYGITPSLHAWLANNVGPHTRRVTALAIGFMVSAAASFPYFLSLLPNLGVDAGLASQFTSAGGLLATWMFGDLSPGPDYSSASILAIAYAAGIGQSCFFFASVLPS